MKEEEARKKIVEQKKGCWYCSYFIRCHTVGWRDGKTCDLFIIDKDKLNN